MARERDDREKARDRAELQPRWDNVFHWSRACSVVLALPALRAFYPTSSVAGGPTSPPGGNCNDISGNGLTLTSTGNPTYGYSNLIPHIYFNGTGDYLIRADSGANDPLDILGTEGYISLAQRGLTFCCWIQTDRGATAEVYMSKWDPTGNQRAYELRKLATNNIRLSVSQNGANINTSDSVATIDNTAWWFVGGRFRPGAFVDAILNEEITPTATAFASLHNSTAGFEISGNAGGTALLVNGRSTLHWVCAAALSDAQIQAVYEQQRAMFGV